MLVPHQGQSRVDAAAWSSPARPARISSCRTTQHSPASGSPWVSAEIRRAASALASAPAAAKNTAAGNARISEPLPADLMPDAKSGAAADCHGRPS